MVRAVGPRRGQLDEFAATVRRGYVAYNDDWRVTRSPWLQIGPGWPDDAEARAHREQRQTELEAKWAEERAHWAANEAFILTTAEMFEALYFINDDRWRRFTFMTDRDETRRWLVPGTVDGGIVLEVEWHNDDDETGDWWIVGTDQRAPGAA